MKKNLTLTGFFVLLALLFFMSPFGAQRVDAAITINTIYIKYGSNQVLSYVNPRFPEEYATTALQNVPAKLRYPKQVDHQGYYVDMSNWSSNTTLCFWWEKGGKYQSCTGRSQNVEKDGKYAVSLLVADDYQNGYTFPDDPSTVKVYVFSEATGVYTLRHDATLNKPSSSSSHNYVLHIPVSVQTATSVTTTGSVELESYCRNPVPGTFMRLDLDTHALTYNFSPRQATIKWYRSKNANMTPSEVVGTGDVYVVTADDIGYYIRGLISPPSPFSPSLYDTSNMVKKSKCYVDVKDPTLKLNGTTVLLTEPKTNQEYFASKTYYSDAQITESLWNKSFKPSSSSTASIAYGDYGDTWYVYTRVRETTTMEAGTDIRRASCYIPLCTIIKDPQDLTVLAGDTASFSIQAKGKIKSYQWRYYNGHSSYNCTGATWPTYSFTAAPGDNGKYYYCVVTDEDGDTYSSDTARLTVNSPVLSNSNTTINCLDSFVYRNRAITPAASVKFKSGSTTRTLQIDKDYTVSVTNNINVGTATITVTGQGIYSGSANRTFQITPVDLSGSEAATSVDAFKAQTWTGMPLIPTSTVKATVDGSVLTLKQGTDYILSYENNVDPGTATVIVIGKGNYTGTVKSAFTIKPASLAGATVTGIKASYAYTGNAIKPKPTVKLGSKTLKAGTDYTVTYAKNVNVGTATVTITGKGNYSGTVKKTFKITAPEKASFQRLYGADRYATSLAIADELKKTLGVSKFDTICVADGVNYPDALAGAYFAYMNKAPIVDVHQNAPAGPQTMNAINYVKANLKTSGRIYILGGPGS
ncbi:MAG: cell wall-binding repeat-containing protein, partial [Firmicutes bacterium]|nr:cell wall-binding repeat-containing protein [Bacillota bacterium]